MIHFTLKRTFLLLLLVCSGLLVNAQAFTEDFNDITTLPGSGWSLQNLSTPVGSTNWFQGTNVAAGGPFDSYNGAANAYIGANYNNTGSTGTISNWLLAPNRTLRNGDVFTFYTRKVAPDSYADRLEVRMSTNGASTNAGTNATTVGDFTTNLLSINPTLVLGIYPTAWTQYTITMSGLPAPTSGRIGFRYFVTGAGLLGTASDYIGIDNVVYTPYVCPTITVTPSTIPDATTGVAYSQSLSQTGALGTPSFAVTAGTLPPGLTLSASGTISGTATAAGTFNFTVTASDASGCSGSLAYSLTVDCPAISITPFALLNDTVGMYDYQSVTLVGGTGPGTFSVTSGSLPFGLTMDPSGYFDGIATSTGNYSFTISVTDIYGCSGSSAYNITTYCSLSGGSLSFDDTACSNESPITLTGGSPVGGTYSGTGVSGGMFDPSVGTQTITYNANDIYNCPQTASADLVVNTGSGNSLAGFPGTTESRTLTVAGPTEARYNDCDLIADIVPSGTQPVNGRVKFSVTRDYSINNYNGQFYVQRHYDIEPLNALPGTTANVTLYAYQGEFNAYNAQAVVLNDVPLLPTGGIDNGNVRITQFHGTGTAPGNYTGSEELIIPAVSWDATNNWWVMNFDITDFSGFYIHTTPGTHPLAIKVSSIAARNEGATNLVSWNTATELEGDAFEVERSIDGKTFIKLADVKANGKASTYNYRDEKPVNGINYYRLKLTSPGTRAGYTQTVSATVRSSGGVQVQAYPNPVTEQLKLDAFGQQGDANINITDVTGRSVLKTTMSNGSILIDLSGLSKGTYFVIYNDAVNTQTIKINKQ